MSTFFDDTPICRHGKPIRNHAGNTLSCSQCAEEAKSIAPPAIVAKKPANEIVPPSPDALYLPQPPLGRAYARILSHGELYDIPVASLEAARRFDPELRILRGEKS